MESEELCLEKLFIHRQELQEEIDKDIEHLKQIGQEMLILTAGLNEKIQLKDKCDQALCE